MTISDATFGFVADLSRRCTAVELPSGKEYLVEARLSPLARQAGLAGVDEYVDTLRLMPHCDIHDRAAEALTTNETSWFRDLTPFQTLTDLVMPALVRDRPAKTPIRVWSAGCSTGQEPYSIAMALLDAYPGLAVEIAATDISQEALRRALAGRYRQIEMSRGLPRDLLARHFTRTGTEWELAEEVRSTVTFYRHNLLDAPAAGEQFDIIFMRNVLMYFNPQTRPDVLGRVGGALAPGGFLVLGAVESTFGVEGAWERVPSGTLSPSSVFLSTALDAA